MLMHMPKARPTPAPEPSPLDALQAAVAQRSPALLDDGFTPEAEVVVHGVSGWAWTGAAERQQAWAALFASVPDLAYVAQRRYLSPEMHSEEGRVSGTFQPADGTGDGPEPFTTSVRLVSRLEEDRVTRLEVWGDAAGLPPSVLPLVTGAVAVAASMSALRGQAQPAELRVLGTTHADPVPPPTAEAAVAADAAPAEEEARRRRPRWVLAAVGLVTLAVLAGLGTLAVVQGGPAPAARDTAVSDASTTASTAPEPSAPPTPSPPTDASAAPEIESAAPSVAPSVQAGEQLVLASDVLFETGSSVLSPEAVQALGTLASSIRERQVTGTIQINGYTDNTGSDAFDLELSRARAQAVAQVLQGALAGVPVRLQPQGFGKANPVADNGLPEGRAQNRRVTIVLPEPTG